jgi:hypothetical protein
MAGYRQSVSSTSKTQKTPARLSRQTDVVDCKPFNVSANANANAAQPWRAFRLLRTLRRSFSAWRRSSRGVIARFTGAYLSAFAGSAFFVASAMYHLC